MITEILVKNGYKADYLETKRFCAKCGDAGVNGGVRCSCFTKLLGKYALEALNDSANMPSCDIEKFSLEYYRQNPDEYKKMSDIFEYIKIYAKKFSTKSESLFFFGKTGLGKTHLSLSIAKEAAKKGYAAAYGSVQNYLRIIEKEHFGRAGDSGGDSLGLLINSDLLVLDDLGSEFHTGFYESALYNIINSRINLGLPTIINSNLNIGELLKIYDGRIISRISAMYEPFEFVGTDIRQMKRFNI
jgi:DNA replication protein DnaC